ncbi:MAG: hypothetical protein WD431_06510 [Cyclobacteriaceae bacterium]
MWNQLQSHLFFSTGNGKIVLLLKTFEKPVLLSNLCVIGINLSPAVVRTNAHVTAVGTGFSKTPLNKMENKDKTSDK